MRIDEKKSVVLKERKEQISTILLGVATKKYSIKIRKVVS